MLAVSGIEQARIHVVVSNIVFKILWKQNESFQMYSQLYVKKLVFQGKCWDNHPQEKGFNKENAPRIQGHGKIRCIIMKYWENERLVGKCNNMKEN